MAKSTVTCVEFFRVASQKLLKSVNAAHGAIKKNKSGTFFMDRGV